MTLLEPFKVVALKSLTDNYSVQLLNSSSYVRALTWHQSMLFSPYSKTPICLKGLTMSISLKYMRKSEQDMNTTFYKRSFQDRCSDLGSLPNHLFSRRLGGKQRLWWVRLMPTLSKYWTQRSHWRNVQNSLDIWKSKCLWFFSSYLTQLTTLKVYKMMKLNQKSIMKVFLCKIKNICWKLNQMMKMM